MAVGKHNRYPGTFSSRLSDQRSSRRIARRLAINDLGHMSTMYRWLHGESLQLRPTRPPPKPRRSVHKGCLVRRCCDRHHRLQRHGRDGSCALLSPKIRDFRDDENLRSSNHALIRRPLSLAGQTASRWPPACSSAPETPPGLLIRAYVAGRRPTGRRRLPSPRLLRSRGSRLPF